MDIDTLLTNLSRNNMAGHFVESKGELIEFLKNFIPEGASVGCGDSVTLEETGCFEFFRNGPYIFYDKHKKELSALEKRELYIKNFSADFFISGTNALCATGELFNIDGNGSRIAPMIYGPQRVIIVVGVNKIVPTVQDAIYRARQVAAPLDAKRLKKSTPCTVLQTCCNCHHPDRICNTFVLLSRQFQSDRIHVVIVNENLGY